MAKSDDKNMVCCSFCGKRESQARLIAGPGVYICSDCVDACRDLLKEEYPEFANAHIVGTPSLVGIRETRHIQGVDMACGEEMLVGTQYPCPVAHSAHPMDIHSAKTSAQSLTYFETAAYVPHGALIPVESQNLLVAGRCLCADRRAYASLRVQATLMSIGECAGVMAAQYCEGNVPMTDLDEKELAKRIAARGCVL